MQHLSVVSNLVPHGQGMQYPIPWVHLQKFNKFEWASNEYNVEQNGQPSSGPGVCEEKNIIKDLLTMPYTMFLVYLAKRFVLKTKQS